MYAIIHGKNFELALRSILGIAGGYVLSVLAGAALSALLPLENFNVVAWAILASYAIFVLGAIWAFAASSLTRASLGIILPAAAFWLFLALMQKPEAPL